MGLLASPLYVFICLVSVFSIVALFFSFPLPPLPSDFDFRRSFRPRARRRALTSHPFAAFNLDTGLLLHTTPCGLSAAGQSFRLLALFSPISLCLHSVHCIAMDSDLDYRYPRLALLKGKQPRPTFSHFVCVRFRATVAHFFSLHLSLHFPRLSRHPIQFQPSTLDIAVCEPVRSTVSLSYFRSSRRHTLRQRG